MEEDRGLALKVNCEEEGRGEEKEEAEENKNKNENEEEGRRKKKGRNKGARKGGKKRDCSDSISSQLISFYPQTTCDTKTDKPQQ